MEAKEKNRQKAKINIFNHWEEQVEEQKRTNDEYPIEMLDLLTTESSGQIRFNKCTENVCRILKNHPFFMNRFRFDEWTEKVEIHNREQNKWTELKDTDFLTIQRQISQMYSPFRSLGKDMTIDAIYSVAHENKFDRAIEFLRSGTWDGENRLDKWLSEAYGCPNDEYHQKVGSNFIKGIVSRVIDPGCKFDTVLIVEGRQKCGKSTSLSVLVGENWHLETTSSIDSKDFFIQFKGKMIVEFAEGAMFAAADQKKMKAIVTTRYDTYREPYGRVVTDHPRRNVFAMTTNDAQFLKDETGNRRYMPIFVEKEFVDIEWIKKNKMQLFYEALHRVENLKETTWEYPEEAALEKQAEKMVENPYEEIIAKWMKNPTLHDSITAIDLNAEGVQGVDVWQAAIGGEPRQYNRREQHLIGEALRRIGFQRIKIQKDGKRSWRWFI